MEPYSQLLKLGLYALLAAVVVGTPAYAMHQRRRAIAAEAEATELRETLAIRAQNEALSRAITGEWWKREEARGASVAKARKEVSNAKVSVPPECRASLRPLALAGQRLRGLEAERRSAPAYADLP